MTDGQKIMGMAVSGLGCIVCAVVGEFEGSQMLIDLAYSFGGVFGLLIGQPIFSKVKSAIATLVK